MWVLIKFSLDGGFLYFQEDEDEDSGEESEDDAALVAELEKIKKEREEERERKVKKRFRVSWFHWLSDSKERKWERKRWHFWVPPPI